jgi:hypothetical protein
MRMIRGGHDDAVKGVLLLLQHLPEIRVSPGLGKILGGRRQAIGVDITQRRKPRVQPGHGAQKPAAPSSHPNEGEIELLIGRSPAHRVRPAQYQKPGRAERGSGEKTPT